MEVLKQGHDHVPGSKVETAGRLIREQHLGVSHQCAGQNHALLLSARQFAGAMRRATSQSHFIEPR